MLVAVRGFVVPLVYRNYLRGLIFGGPFGLRICRLSRIPQAYPQAARFRALYSFMRSALAFLQSRHGGMRCLMWRL